MNSNGAGNCGTVFITGGTGRLGSVFVRYLFKKGFKVIFAARDRNKIDSLVDELSAQSVSHKEARIYGVAIDCEDQGAVGSLMKYFSEADLWPDTLINNVRNIQHLKLGDNGMPSRDSWRGEFLLNIVMPYELTMTLALKRESRLRNVINIASMYGIVAANPNIYDDPQTQSPIHYGVAKAGSIHMTKELAVRLSAKGLRVNSISFGGVEGQVDENFKKKYSNYCPSKRMLQLDDIVGPLEFLISDSSSGMTGHNLVVDGGWTIW